MDLTPAIMSALAAAIAAPLFMALARRVKALRHEPDPRASRLPISSASTPGGNSGRCRFRCCW